VSYQAQFQLTGDSDFNGRSQAAATQQAEVFKDDQRPNFVAVSQDVLRGNLEVLSTFVRMGAAGPGIADKADNGDGTIDQSLVSDADLLSLTQANWPTVAALYFAADGSPL
jgi:hypothetical protein